jgi:hypothetical protein
MKRTTVALLSAFVLALPIVGLAQGKTDFSGTWKFDEAKSDPAPAGRGGGRGGGGTPSQLVIKQAGGQITIETTTANGTQSVAYKLDGSESVNKLAMGESKGKATWDGANLVINSSQQLQTQAGTFDITSKEVYNLAGTVLTITTTRTTARGENTRKTVFNKG